MARRPEQAVLDHIAGRRPARTRQAALVGGGEGDTDVPISIGGAPGGAHPDTGEILQEGQILRPRVYVVGFLADHQRRGRVAMTMVVRAERVGGLGWIARGISAGMDPPDPQLDEPRVLLSGSWGRFGFCGGGKVYGAGAEIDRVRLR